MLINDMTEKRKFNIANGVDAIVHLPTGDVTTIVNDITDPILGVAVNHFYKRYSSSLLNSLDTWTNFEEKLYKTVAGEYVFVDCLGERHVFLESYYKLDKKGNRVVVNAESKNITVDGSGRFWLGNQEVFREMHTKDGLRATTRLEDINDVEWLEQRYDEEKEAEERTKALKDYLLSFVLIRENDGTEVGGVTEIVLENPEHFEALMKQNSAYDTTGEEIVEYPLILLTEQEMLSYRQLLNTQAILYADRRALVSQINEYHRQYQNSETTAVQKEYIKDKINMYDAFKESVGLYDANSSEGFLTIKLKEMQVQINNTHEQILFLKAKGATYREDIRVQYKEYREIIAYAEKVSLSVPISFIMFESGMKGFNKNGQLIAMQSREGKHLAIEWECDKNGDYKLASIQDEDENKMVFVYRESGLSKIINSQGETVCFDSNTTWKPIIERTRQPNLFFEQENGHISQINIDGRDTVTFSYDATNRLSEIVTTTTIKEISHGVLTEITKEESPAELSRIGLTYAENEVTITMQDPERKEIYTFYENTDLLAGIYTVEQGVVVQAENYNYDEASERLVEKIEYAKNSLYEYSYEDFCSSAGSGNNEVYSYNEFGELVRVERCLCGAAGTSTVKEFSTIDYTYNTAGKVTCVKTTTEEYDSDGVAVETTVSFEETFYNSAGKPVKVCRYTEGKENELGIDISETIYDKDGKRLRSYSYNTLSPSDKTYTESETDESGRTVADLDITGKHKTSYIYFADGSLASEHFPNGSVLSYAYDKEGNTVSVTASTADGEGNTNVTHYTAGLVTRVESGNHVVDYEYDAKRRLTKVKLDGADYETYTYTDGENGDETVTMRRVGTEDSVTTVRDASKNVTNLYINGSCSASFTYTNDGRVLTATDTQSVKSFSYSYDAEKRLIGSDYFQGTKKTFAYDEKDRLTEKNVIYTEESWSADGPQEKEITYAYAYDENTGRLSTLTVDEDTIVTPSYDAIGRSAGKSIRYHDALIAQEKIDYLKHGDHAAALPLTVRYAKGNTWTDRMRYTYDCMGNITTVYEDEVLVCRYEYDTLGRLTREDNRHFGKSKLFFYDGNGNILSRREYAFTVKSTEELTEIEPTAVVEYKYDGDKLISYNGNTGFAYVGGRATRFCGKSIPSTFGASYSVFDKHGTPLNRFCDESVYGGSGVTRDADGNVLSNENFRFLYDDKGIMGCINKNDETMYFYRRDIQGNVIAILDTNGDVMVEYKYDAWGNFTMHEVGEAAINCGLGYMNPILYRGYYYDFTLGMYHLITRYYDPETGRFTSADTVDYLAPDTINGLNLYAYCGNNPVMNVDPTGHAWWDWVVAVAVVVVCAVAAVATAGTSLVAGAALAGAAVGGGLSVATQAVDVAQNGGDFSWGQFAADTAIGALSGVAGAGLTSALPLTGLLATTAGTIVGGAIPMVGAVAGAGLIAFARTPKHGGYYGERWPGDPHKPDHIHLRGNKTDVRIGRDGNPLPGEKQLDPQAKKALKNLWDEFVKLFNKWQ